MPCTVGAGTGVRRQARQEACVGRVGAWLGSVLWRSGRMQQVDAGSSPQLPPPAWRTARPLSSTLVAGHTAHSTHACSARNGPHAHDDGCLALLGAAMPGSALRPWHAAACTCRVLYCPCTDSYYTYCGPTCMHAPNRDVPPGPVVHGTRWTPPPLPLFLVSRLCRAALPQGRGARGGLGAGALLPHRGVSGRRRRRRRRRRPRLQHPAPAGPRGGHLHHRSIERRALLRHLLRPNQRVEGCCAVPSAYFHGTVLAHLACARPAYCEPDVRVHGGPRPSHTAHLEYVHTLCFVPCCVPTCACFTRGQSERLQSPGRLSP